MSVDIKLYCDGCGKERGVVLNKIYCWNRFCKCKYRKRNICTETNIRCIYRHDEPDPFRKKRIKEKPDQIIKSHTRQNISRKVLLSIVQQGLRNKDIAQIYGVPPTTVHYWLNKFKITRKEH